MWISFRKAKDTIQRLVAKLQGGPLDNEDNVSVTASSGGGGGQTGQIELMVPGGKVGLIIGKGGETIKQLQVSLHSVQQICAESLRVVEWVNYSVTIVIGKWSNNCWHPLT
jgi:predicted RNA-binding protein YlqC (UPF0109 family)